MSYGISRGIIEDFIRNGGVYDEIHGGANDGGHVLCVINTYESKSWLRAYERDYRGF